MSKETFVVVYLSISLAAVQYMWLRAEKKAAYLEGRASVYIEIQKASEEMEGYCLADTPSHVGPCNDKPKVKRHK